jgi:hypothetical protein
MWKSNIRTRVTNLSSSIRAKQCRECRVIRFFLLFSASPFSYFPHLHLRLTTIDTFRILPLHSTENSPKVRMAHPYSLRETLDPVSRLGRSDVTTSHIVKKSILWCIIYSVIWMERIWKSGVSWAKIEVLGRQNKHKQEIETENG